MSEATPGRSRRPPRHLLTGNFEPSFLAQLSIAALSTTAVLATRPMMTYRALSLSASPLEIGLIAAVFSIAPAILAVAIGRSIDRHGERRFIMLAMLAIAVGGLMAAAVGTLELLAVSQVIMGLGHVTNLIAGQSLIANAGGREGREHRYGLYATMGSVGHLAGPLLAVWLVHSSPFLPAARANAQAPAFIAASGVAAVAFALTLLLSRDRRAHLRGDPATDESPPRVLSAARSVLRRPGMPLAMLVSMVTISSLDVLIAYLPLYGEVRGVPVAVIGTLLAIRAGSSLVSRLFMARLIHLLGRNVLAASMGVAALGFVIVPFTESPLVLGVLMVLIGLGLGIGQPMTMVWVANRSPRAERATALGVRLTGNRSALVAVPIAVGALSGVAGVGVIFWLLAALLGVGASASLVRPLGAATPADEELNK